MHSLLAQTERFGLRRRTGSSEWMAGTAICTSKALPPWDCRRELKRRCGREQIAEWCGWKTVSGETFRCQWGCACKTSRQLQRTMKRASGFATRAKDSTTGLVAVSPIFQTSLCSRAKPFSLCVATTEEGYGLDLTREASLFSMRASFGFILNARAWLAGR